MVDVCILSDVEMVDCGLSVHSLPLDCLLSLYSF